ncbi:MAG: adenine-specific methyltransferase EcoRI family protein [Synergistaceae bacterium]|nr:adenine-specific methyltransferase EcoRI family protein [Synergistaceae bacterium]
MANNRALHRAARAQQDEFYTQMSDIENELRNYREHFEGKKILCNCDDPYESNFFRYFAIRFNEYNLAKLTATCYTGSPIAHTQLSIDFEETSLPTPLLTKRGEQDPAVKSLLLRGDIGGSKLVETPARVPYCAEITELKDYNEDMAEDLQDIRYILEHNVGGGVRKLQGNGDFRSPECIELLKEADLVVTNPPFSLLREFIALLIQYGKKFVIVGNVNAITYKEVFPLFMHNQMWLGHSIHSGDRKFNVPDTYPLDAAGCGIDDDGRKFIRVKGVRWFTNLDHGWRHRDMILTRSYESNPELYPHYDNYDAIEVSKTSDIPADYFGVMGVPITFMDKYNPDQFEIVGMAKRGAGDPALRTRVYTRDEFPNYSDLNAGPVLVGKDGKLHNTYPRILIRRKKAE